MATVASFSHLDHTQHTHATGLDWQRIAYLTLLSRAIDDLEETELLKNREVLYQFSARGHDMAQIILATCWITPATQPAVTTVHVRFSWRWTSISKTPSPDP